MKRDAELGTGRVLALFTEAAAARGGKVADSFDDGRRLFARSILPAIEEVRPRDGMQGGVALRSEAGSVRVYPYLFRLVCQNGAIMAQTLGARQLEDLDLYDPADAEELLREAIDAACAPGVFHANIEGVRASADQGMDLALNLMPMLARSGINDLGVLSQIADQFHREGDFTRFGLANAVTAVARTIRRPVRRWNLEELGGSLLLAFAPPPPFNPPRRKPPSARLLPVG